MTFILKNTILNFVAAGGISVSKHILYSMKEDLIKSSSYSPDLNSFRGLDKMWEG